MARGLGEGVAHLVLVGHVHPEVLEQAGKLAFQGRWRLLVEHCHRQSSVEQPADRGEPDSAASSGDDRVFLVRHPSNLATAWLFRNPARGTGLTGAARKRKLEPSICFVTEEGCP
ncbi:predicted protein [Streptomyces sp. AA4]|nr:predicted protein [Streptomyces sp. AA4]